MTTATALNGLVFVDGHFARAHSQPNVPPNKVYIERLSIASDAIIVAAVLGQAATTEGAAFTALNTALFARRCGRLSVPEAVIEQPIHLLFVSNRATRQRRFPIRASS